MTFDCGSVSKHVLKYYDNFTDVHDHRNSCRGSVVSLSHATKIVPCKSAQKLAPPPRNSKESGRVPDVKREGRLQGRLNRVKSTLNVTFAPGVKMRDPGNEVASAPGFTEKNHNKQPGWL